MMNDEDSIELTCTKCGERQKFHCLIVYSQGLRVCLECKKENQASDDRAYDAWASSPSRGSAEW